MKRTWHRLAAALAFCIWAGLGATPARAASWGPWEMRAMAGAEGSAGVAGIVDFGLRKGPLSLQILTDTLELRFAPELAHGRYFVALRGETYGAGLMFLPWSNGAPAPERALFSAYISAEGGYVRYLPASLYVGVAGAARLYLFWTGDNATITAPGPTPVFSADAVIGHYTPTSHVWVRAGVDAELQQVAPHVVVEATMRPDWTLAPRVEVRGAWAMNQDFITRTRLGGLNPYVVPLAGAAWAEFWVESYIALRVGPSLRAKLPGRGPHTLELTPVADIAGFGGDSTLGFTGGTAVGFGLLAKWRLRRLFLEASGGYAPWIKRQEGVPRMSAFLLVGLDWGRGWKP